MAYSTEPASYNKTVLGQLLEIKKLLLQLKYMPTPTQLFWLLYPLDYDQRNSLLNEFSLIITIQLTEEIFNFKILSTCRVGAGTFHRTPISLVNFVDRLIGMVLFFFNHKIIPSIQFVNNIVYILCGIIYYDAPDIETIIKNEGMPSYCYYNILDATMMFSALQASGYTLNTEQALLLTGHNVYISNIEDYGIDINQEKFHELIFKNDCKIYKTKLKPSLRVLQYKITRNITIAELREFTKTIKPDIKCLSNAVERSTIIIVKHLVEECNVQPDLEILKKAVINNPGAIANYITEKICQLYKDVKLNEQEVKLYAPVTKIKKTLIKNKDNDK
jgi:hypothetical protein